MILVTGATGTVGSEVIRLLLVSGQRSRAWIRSPGRADELRKAGAEVALGDFGKPETYREALAGVTKAFLLSAATPRIAEHETAFINAAKDAGVQHVVLLSAAGAAFQPGITLGKLHRASELALEASGMAWTVLRPSGFMTNFFAYLGSVKGEGRVYGCTGSSPSAPIDPRDVAAVAVKALTEPGHEGKTYTLTGPELLDAPTMAQKMASAIGKAVVYVDAPAEGVKSAMLRAGMGEWLAASTMELYLPGAREQAGKLSGDVQKVLGRAPRGFDAWTREFGAAFR